MSLSCECVDSDGWYYYDPDDYAPLATTRAKRCCSCKALIRVGDLSVRFPRERRAESYVEERIYGEGGEIGLAPWFMCEACGDQYFNLVELGFCIDIGESMDALRREYVENYHPQQGEKP